MPQWGSLNLIALDNFLSKTQEERLERRNVAIKNLTHLKICPCASPEIKYDLIKAFPVDHSHIFMCVCVNACVCVCVCVCAFQTTKCCHTVFQQLCVLTIAFLSFVNEDSRV